MELMFDNLARLHSGPECKIKSYDEMYNIIKDSYDTHHVSRHYHWTPIRLHTWPVELT